MRSRLMETEECSDGDKARQRPPDKDDAPARKSDRETQVEGDRAQRRPP
jgi:hypothetical protein